jgi:hypothetical protein
MSTRKGIYLLGAFNVFCITGLAACVFLMGSFRSPDFAAMRSKIEASPSLEDLRPRSLHAISAIQSADSALAHSREVIGWLVIVGITSAVVNSLALYLLLPRVSQL